MSTFFPRLHPVSKTNANDDNFVPRFELQSLEVGRQHHTSPGEIRLLVESCPAPNITWYRNRNIIRDRGRFKIVVREMGEKKFLTVLTIEHFSNSDAGQYTCVAHNGFGSAQFNVNVGSENESRKPDVVKAPRIDYLGNSKYLMTVTIWSRQKQSIFWRKFKRGKELRLDTKKLSSDGVTPRITISAKEVRKHMYEISMEIREATRTDKGIYRCEIGDSAGNLKCDFPLNCEKGTPEGRPELVAEPRIVQMKTQSLLMAFCIQSDTEPEFSWVLPDGKTVPVSELDTTLMEFKTEKLEEEGEDTFYHGQLQLIHWFSVPKGIYICLVRNSGGCLEIKFNLEIANELADSLKSDWYKTSSYK